MGFQSKPTARLGTWGLCQNSSPHCYTKVILLKSATRDQNWQHGGCLSHRSLLHNSDVRNTAQSATRSTAKLTVIFLSQNTEKCSKSYRGEAESDVQVVADAAEVVLIQVLIGRWSPWKLLLHDGYQLTQDLVHLVTRKQVGHLSLRHVRMRLFEWLIQPAFMWQNWPFLQKACLFVFMLPVQCSACLKPVVCWTELAKLTD